MQRGEEKMRGKNCARKSRRLPSLEVRGLVGVVQVSTGVSSNGAFLKSVYMSLVQNPRRIFRRNHEAPRSFQAKNQALKP